MAGAADTVAAAPRGGVASDALLVDRVRGGDDAAFEELFRRYYPRVRAFVAARVRDSGRADDLTQDAFLSALNRLRVTDSQMAFKPWLFEIARNATIDLHRRRSRTEEVPVDHLELEGAAPPESEVLAKERLEYLQGAFDELNDTHHRILVMRELEGRSYREIGERMELSHSAVESALFRARRRLESEYEALAAGRRCRAALGDIAAISEGVQARGPRRRLARHARRCSSCRRHAREMGVEPLPRLAALRSRVPALLPIPWLLRRRGAGDLLLGPANQVFSNAAERTAALVTAAALASAGSAVLGEAGERPLQGPGAHSPAPPAEVRQADPLGSKPAPKLHRKASPADRAGAWRRGAKPAQPERFGGRRDAAQGPAAAPGDAQPDAAPTEPALPAPPPAAAPSPALPPTPKTSPYEAVVLPEPAAQEQARLRVPDAVVETVKGAEAALDGAA